MVQPKNRRLATEEYADTTANAAASAAASAIAVPVQSVAGKTGAVAVTKGDVGLSNVDNTSDANKPLSSATVTALSTKVNTGDPTESVQDIVGAALRPGTNVTIDYNDIANTITIGSTAGVNSGSGQTLYADRLPADSGLTSIAANDGNNDAPRIQAALDYIKTTYGGGTLVLPANKYIRCNDTITIPAKVRMIGNFTTLNYFFAATTITAVVVNDSNYQPMSGISLNGPGTGDGTSQVSTTTTGLLVTGSKLKFRDVRINGFNFGIDLTNSGTSQISFDHTYVANCNVALNLDMAAAFLGGTDVTGNGGRINFSSSEISNSKVGFVATTTPCSVFFNQCTFANLNLFGRVRDSTITFSDSTLDSRYVDPTATSWGSTVSYLFDLTASARVHFSNCKTDIATAGVYSLVNPANGPANYNIGQLRIVDYQWFGTIPTGGARTYNSRDVLSWTDTDPDTKTIYSPFISKWNPIFARFISNDQSTVSFGYSIVITNVTATSYSMTLRRVVPAGESARVWTWFQAEY